MFGLGLYHMRAAPHAICFERPGEPGCGGVLSTGVYGCTWFSFGFAVSFAVRVFFLALHQSFVWISNGKLLWAYCAICNSY